MTQAPDPPEQAEPETNLWSTPEPPAYQPPAYQPPTYAPPISGVPVSSPTAEYPPAYQPYPSSYPVPYAPPPAVYAPVSLAYDPITGQALSPKSKIAAGLLQLLPAFFFGLGGIGRLYQGQTALGVIQLVATVVGWASFWCGFLLIIPFFIYGAIWLWFVIDGVLLLAGRPVDEQGRLLRS